MFLFHAVTSVSPSAAVLPPPAAVRGRKRDIKRVKVVQTCSFGDFPGVQTPAGHSLQQRAQQHDENAADDAHHQRRGQRLLPVVGGDDGQQVGVFAPHADEACVAPAAGTETRLCPFCGKGHSDWDCLATGTHTHAGVSSSTRKRQVPWKQKWRWVSGQSSKCDRTAAATNSVRQSESLSVLLFGSHMGTSSHAARPARGTFNKDLSWGLLKRQEP